MRPNRETSASETSRITTLLPLPSSIFSTFSAAPFSFLILLIPRARENSFSVDLPISHFFALIGDHRSFSRHSYDAATLSSLTTSRVCMAPLRIPPLFLWDFINVWRPAVNGRRNRLSAPLCSGLQFPFIMPSAEDAPVQDCTPFLRRRNSTVLRSI